MLEAGMAVLQIQVQIVSQPAHRMAPWVHQLPQELQQQLRKQHHLLLRQLMQ